LAEPLLQLVDGLAVGSIYAGIALGLTLVYGLLRILHIAHAGVYVVGAYTAYTVYSATQSPLLSMASAMASSALLGVAINRFFYKPLLNQPRYVPLIVSIVLFIVIEELVANFFGHYPKGFHVEMLSGEINVGGATLSMRKLTVFFIVLVATLVTWALTTRTRLGVASQAAAQDMEIAITLGVRIPLIIDFNFLLGSALAGLAGFLYGYYYGMISPFMGGVVAYKGLVVIVLGGFGSVMGAYLGGIILGLVEQVMTALYPEILPREAYAFIALVVLLLVRPYGILGRREVA